MTTDRLDRLAARCVIAGIQGPVPTADELALVQRGLGGVVLFSRNVQDPPQVAELSRTLKAQAPGKLLLCIDQEGGRVQRLKAPYWTPIPSMRRLGDLDAQGGLLGLSGRELVERLARLVAGELRACGLDWDFAPVVDVDTNPLNPVIGERSFGADAGRVARLGVWFAQALEQASVASCVKHFPGHGDTAQDSHKTLPHLAKKLDELTACELVPFVAAARAQLASVMTAHVTFDALDALPATLSPLALELLRNQVGFGGVCVSDDLEMAAIVQDFGVVDSAPKAIAAGCDAVLVCHTLALQHGAIDAIAGAARTGLLKLSRLEEAAARVQELSRFACSPQSIDPSKAKAACGTPEHLAFVASLGAPVARASDPTESSARRTA